MSAVYHIQDEPTGSRSHALIVNPFWSLLAMMLAGAWLGTLMFGLSAVLLRGPTWRRELLLSVLVLLGAPVLFILIRIAEVQQWLPHAWVRYAEVGITVWKLALAYGLFFLQQNAFALYEYFGGNARETQRGSVGTALVVVGLLFRPSVLGAVNYELWYWMVK
jgi:hypothetical protein